MLKLESDRGGAYVRHPTDCEDPENYPPQPHLSNHKSSNWLERFIITDSEHQERKALLFYIFALLIVGLGDLFYNEPLYALTLEYVPLWQKGYDRTSFAVQFLRVVTYFGEGYAGALAFAIAFAFSSRDRAFYILLAHTCASIVNKTLKIVYRNPRPYMVDAEITAFGCSKSFGNPSGHSSLSACLYITIFLLIFHDNTDKHGQTPSSSLREPLLNIQSTPSLRTYYSQKKKQTRSPFLDKLIYTLSAMLVILIIFTVGMSRVLLGVHSMNQVVYGWSYGAWIAFFLFRYVRPGLKEHIIALLDYRQPLKGYLSYYLFRALLIWASVTTFTLLNYLLAKRDFVIPPP